MKPRPLLLLVLAASGLTACAAPRASVGVGYGVGDVRVGASTDGRRVVPRVGVRSGHFYGWTVGPDIPLRNDSRPIQRGTPPPEGTAAYPPAPHALPPSTGGPVRGQPGPGVDSDGASD